MFIEINVTKMNRELFFSNAVELYNTYLDKLEDFKIEEKFDVEEISQLKELATRQAMDSIRHLTCSEFSTADYYLMKYIIETKAR